MKLLLVGGTRPNFVKIAPIAWALRDLWGISAKGKKKKGSHIFRIVHTGQHYDYELSKAFFEELDIPKPDFFLNAGSGTHAEQTGVIMVEFEKTCQEEKPDVVVVVGDVNSTLACSIVAKKCGIPVAHIEAGLRSRDLRMPEEINRIVTDSISDFLFVTEKSGVQNLKKEGKSETQIFFTGNVMVDTLLTQLPKLKKKTHPRFFEGNYAVATLHRPSNVENTGVLRGILEAFVDISHDFPIVFPVHPRTRKYLESFGLNNLFTDGNITIMDPLPYLEFLSLWKDSSLVLTDSGGLQEETTVLKVPCFTVRENTERPVTVELGTNRIVGTERKKIYRAFEDFRKKGKTRGKIPPLWDGKAAPRIVDILGRIFS
ncbi:MAG: UDP-N-acetylglucosamine 2-epimerase (non-hydrolyzing) [Candidatus Aminicenantes bacterium]|nr:UDP-N-acetylglucosamine 2-epimerase (non-hydrolyzing) [Candidatus Aminicenantes bacterium]